MVLRDAGVMDHRQSEAMQLLVGERGCASAAPGMVRNMPGDERVGGIDEDAGRRTGGIRMGSRPPAGIRREGRNCCRCERPGG